MVATGLSLNIVYMQLLDEKAMSRYPWATPQFYTYHLQHLLSRAYISLKQVLIYTVWDNKYFINYKIKILYNYYIYFNIEFQIQIIFFSYFEYTEITKF